MTFKNNRAPLLCYFKLCASFRSHRWFQTWVTVRKRPSQIRRFLEPCDLAIWRMTFKNNRAPLLFYFKLCAHFVTNLSYSPGPIWVKFDVRAVWPWNLTDDLARAPLLCLFKLCASFRPLVNSNWSYSPETPNPNSTIFRVVWPCNLTYDLAKQ